MIGLEIMVHLFPPFQGMRGYVLLQLTGLWHFGWGREILKGLYFLYLQVTDNLKL
jgi:hypothetical protein